jgi:tRNA nucleotidyltransferase/poly(A) polymerase
LSVERIAYEILRLLEAQDPVEAVGLAEQAGVLKALFPKINSWILGLGMLSSLIQFERANDVSPKSLRRLVALFAGDASEISKVGHQLKLSNAQKNFTHKLVKSLEYFKPNISKKEGRQLLYAYGPIIFREFFCYQAP